MQSSNALPPSLTQFSCTMKRLPSINMLLCAMALLYPPPALASSPSKCFYLLLVLLLQTTGACFAIFHPPPIYNRTSNTRAQQIIRVKNLLLIAGSSLVNYIITLKLTRNRIAWRNPASSWSTRRFRLIIIFWMLLKVCEGGMLLIHVESPSVAHTIGFLSMYFMLNRLEGAMLYLTAEFLQMALQLQLLNAKLERWHPLEVVMQLSRQHSQVLTTIDKAGNICGPVIASNSFLCIFVLLDDFSNLMMIGDFETQTGVYMWAFHAFIAFSVHIICLANVGEELASTSRRTIPICQRMCDNLDRALILSEREELRFQYQLIAQESHHRKTTLHANGFFPVDHSMVIFIVFNVCNNLVALCQFISKQSD